MMCPASTSTAGNEAAASDGCPYTWINRDIYWSDCRGSENVTLKPFSVRRDR